MHRKWIWLACACACSLGVLASRAAETKIAVVDLERVMKAYKDTKAAESLIQQQIDDYELEKGELEEKLEQLKEDFEAARGEAENKLLTDSARDQKMETARDRLLALKRYEREMRDTLSQRKRELAERGARMSRRIVGKLQEKIQAYAEEKGFSLVIDSAAMSAAGSQIILYAADSVDITDPILKLTEEPAGE